MCFDRSKLSEWESINAPTTVLNWLKFGVVIPFSKTPEPFLFQNRPFSAKKHNFIQEEISRLLTSGVICKDDSIQHVSPINCVPKKNKSFRLVIDLRNVNSYVQPCSFQYEDINSILEFVSPKDKLITLDIKDGFYHVPISLGSLLFVGV